MSQPKTVPEFPGYLGNHDEMDFCVARSLPEDSGWSMTNSLPNDGQQTDWPNSSPSWVSRAISGTVTDASWLYNWRQVRLKWQPRYFFGESPDTTQRNSVVPSGDYFVPMDAYRDVDSYTMVYGKKTTDSYSSGEKRAERRFFTWFFVVIGLILVSAACVPVLLHILIPGDSSEYENVEEMGDTSSNEFQHLNRNFGAEIDLVYKNSSVGRTYRGCEVQKCTNGSVVVQYNLFFDPDPKLVPSYEKLKEILYSVDRDPDDNTLGVLGDYRFRISSVEFIETNFVTRRKPSYQSRLQQLLATDVSTKTPSKLDNLHNPSVHGKHPNTSHTEFEVEKQINNKNNLDTQNSTDINEPVQQNKAIKKQNKQTNGHPSGNKTTPTSVSQIPDAIVSTHRTMHTDQWGSREPVPSGDQTRSTGQINNGQVTTSTDLHLSSPIFVHPPEVLLITHNQLQKTITPFIKNRTDTIKNARQDSTHKANAGDELRHDSHVVHSTSSSPSLHTATRTSKTVLIADEDETTEISVNAIHQTTTRAASPDSVTSADQNTVVSTIDDNQYLWTTHRPSLKPTLQRPTTQLQHQTPHTSSFIEPYKIATQREFATTKFQTDGNRDNRELNEIDGAADEHNQGVESSWNRKNVTVTPSLKKHSNLVMPPSGSIVITRGGFYMFSTRPLNVVTETPSSISSRQGRKQPSVPPPLPNKSKNTGSELNEDIDITATAGPLPATAGKTYTIENDGNPTSTVGIPKIGEVTYSPSQATTDGGKQLELDTTIYPSVRKAKLPTFNELKVNMVSKVAHSDMPLYEKGTSALPNDADDILAEKVNDTKMIRSKSKMRPDKRRVILEDTHDNAKRKNIRTSVQPTTTDGHFQKDKEPTVINTALDTSTLKATTKIGIKSSSEPIEQKKNFSPSYSNELPTTLRKPNASRTSKQRISDTYMLYPKTADNVVETNTKPRITNKVTHSSSGPLTLELPDKSNLRSGQGTTQKYDTGKTLQRIEGDLENVDITVSTEPTKHRQDRQFQRLTPLFISNTATPLSSIKGNLIQAVSTSPTALNTNTLTRSPSSTVSELRLQEGREALPTEKHILNQIMPEGLDAVSDTYDITAKDGETSKKSVVLPSTEILRVDTQKKERGGTDTAFALPSTKTPGASSVRPTSTAGRSVESSNTKGVNIDSVRPYRNRHPIDMDMRISSDSKPLSLKSINAKGTSDGRSFEDGKKEEKQLKSNHLTSTKGGMSKYITPVIRVLSKDNTPDIRRISEDITPDIRRMPAGITPDIRGMPKDIIPDIRGMPKDITPDIRGMPKDITPDIRGMPKDITPDIRGMPKDIIPDIRGMSKDITPDIRRMPKDIIPDIRGMPKDIIPDIRRMPKDIIPDIRGMPKDSIPDIRGMPKDIIPDIRRMPKDITPDIRGMPKDIIPDIRRMPEGIIPDIRGMPEGITPDIRRMPNDIIPDIRRMPKDIIPDIRRMPKDIIPDIRRMPKGITPDIRGMPEDIIPDIRRMPEGIIPDIRGMPEGITPDIRRMPNDIIPDIRRMPKDIIPDIRRMPKDIIPDIRRMPKDIIPDIRGMPEGIIPDIRRMPTYIRRTITTPTVFEHSLKSQIFTSNTPDRHAEKYATTQPWARVPDDEETSSSSAPTSVLHMLDVKTSRPITSPTVSYDMITKPTTFSSPSVLVATITARKPGLVEGITSPTTFLSTHERVDEATLPTTLTLTTEPYDGITTLLTVTRTSVPVYGTPSTPITASNQAPSTSTSSPRSIASKSDLDGVVASSTVLPLTTKGEQKTTTPARPLTTIQEYRITSRSTISSEPVYEVTSPRSSSSGPGRETELLMPALTKPIVQVTKSSYTPRLDITTVQSKNTEVRQSLSLEQGTDQSLDNSMARKTTSVTNTEQAHRAETHPNNNLATVTHIPPNTTKVNQAFRDDEKNAQAMHAIEASQTKNSTTARLLSMKQNSGTTSRKPKLQSKRKATSKEHSDGIAKDISNTSRNAQQGTAISRNTLTSLSMTLATTRGTAETPSTMTTTTNAKSLAWQMKTAKVMTSSTKVHASPGDTGLSTRDTSEMTTTPFVSSTLPITTTTTTTTATTAVTTTAAATILITTTGEAKTTTTTTATITAKREAATKATVATARTSATEATTEASTAATPSTATATETIIETTATPATTVTVATPAITATPSKNTTVPDTTTGTTTAAATATTTKTATTIRTTAKTTITATTTAPTTTAKATTTARHVTSTEDEEEFNKMSDSEPTDEQTNTSIWAYLNETRAIIGKSIRLTWLVSRIEGWTFIALARKPYRGKLELIDVVSSITKGGTGGFSALTIAPESSFTDHNATLYVDIPNLKCGDEGQYFVRVTNDTGTISEKVDDLYVYGKPSAKLTLPHELVEGKWTEGITCDADLGYPPGKVIWQVKKRNDTHFATFSSSLHEHNVTAPDPCSTRVTYKVDALFDHKLDWNYASIRCVVTDTPAITSQFGIEISNVATIRFVPSQYPNPIWPPGGHVECLVIATPPDPQQLETRNQVQCIRLGMKACLNEIHDPDSSKMAAMAAILKLAFNT